MRPIITASFLPMAVGSAFFAQMTASGLNRTNRRSLWRLGLFVLGVVAGLAILLLADKLSALLYGPIAVQVAPAFPRSVSVSRSPSIGDERKLLGVAVLTAVVSTGTNVVLIPIWGATGAAVGLADCGVGPDFAVSYPQRHLLRG